MNEFHDDNGLAYAGAAEQTDLAAQGVGFDQVDDLDTGFEHFRRRGLFRKCRSRTMDRPIIGCFNGGGIVVDGLAEDVEDTAQGARADRDLDRRAGVDCIHAANQTVGGTHGNRTDDVVADMLHDFRGQMDLDAVADDTIDMDRVIDSRQAIWRKFNVDNRADDLYYLTSHL